MSGIRLLGRSPQPLITRRAIALGILCLCAPGAAAAQPPLHLTRELASSSAITAPQTPTTQAAAATTGRVVVTIVVEGLRIPAVNVELRDADRNVSIARTISDTIGQVTFPDVPAGRYLVKAVREGFADSESAPFTVQGGETQQVLVEMRLTFVRESVEVVVPANSPTESLQPVAVSDLLTGAKMDIQPLAGDDFQSLLTVLPSIIRGPDGRLRIKGGAPTTGALQMSSASLNDPSTGDFDLELPSGAVESVEVLSNPFAAEYGRFSTSVTQVRTKRGTEEWVFKPNNLMPGFGKGFAFVNKFEPRFSISGPLKRDRLLLGQYFQVPLRPHARSRACPTSPSSASTASTRSRGSTPHCRRGMRSPAGSSTSRAKSRTRRCRRFAHRRRRRSSRRRASRRAWSIGSFCQATPCSSRRSPRAPSRST